MSNTIDNEMEAELGAMLRAGHERQVIEKLHKEAGLNFRQATTWIKYYWRRSLIDPPLPCPHCGELLRTNKAQQCFSCGKDWHARPTEDST